MYLPNLCAHRSQNARGEVRVRVITKSIRFGGPLEPFAMQQMIDHISRVHIVVYATKFQVFRLYFILVWSARNYNFKNLNLVFVVRQFTNQSPTEFYHEFSLCNHD